MTQHFDTQTTDEFGNTQYVDETVRDIAGFCPLCGVELTKRTTRALQSSENEVIGVCTSCGYVQD